MERVCKISKILIISENMKSEKFLNENEKHVNDEWKASKIEKQKKNYIFKRNILI